jgi:hypothetical protein
LAGLFLSRNRCSFSQGLGHAPLFISVQLFGLSFRVSHAFSVVQALGVTIFLLVLSVVRGPSFPRFFPPAIVSLGSFSACRLTFPSFCLLSSRASQSFPAFIYYTSPSFSRFFSPAIVSLGSFSACRLTFPLFCLLSSWVSQAFTALQALGSQSFASFYLSYGSFVSRFFSPATVSLGSLSACRPTLLSFSYSLLRQSHPLAPSPFITLPVVALSPSSFSVSLSSWFIVRLFLLDDLLVLRWSVLVSSNYIPRTVVCSFFTVRSS